MNKTCIFCGSRVDSNEDVWPKWVIRLLRTSKDERVPMKTRRYKSPPKEWLTTHSALKAGVVCRTCNNGWMSRLETDVRLILSPMILGSAITLSGSQQERIVTWLTKAALIFDSMDKGEVFYDALDRHHFRKAIEPFPETYVWLGRYTTTCGIRSFSDHRTLLTKLSSGNSAKIHVLTWCIGQLVLQITSVKRLAHSDLAAKMDFQSIGPKLSDALVQAWPVNLLDVTWPPSLSFNDKERHLKALAARFGGDRS
jgi:hypothetical protein